MTDPSPVLNLPKSRPERWTALRTLIGQWYKPLSDDDGARRTDLDEAEHSLGISLPITLREWYTLAGNRHDVWCAQDQLVRPESLAVRDDVLVFYIENQGVVRWGIPVASLGLDDPPVVVESVDQANHWITENRTLSEFAVQMAVFNIKWSSKNRCWANGVGNSAAFDLIAANYPHFAFPDWYWPCGSHTKFYGFGDIIIETNHGTDWIWVATRTESSYQRFCSLLAPAGIQWESSSDEWPAGWVSSGDDS
ncbi:MAG: hypothetical protein CMJ48_09575 [Planctomycetaceae bacterium]|nr:hypothetical protein [Planctomycetaceae bacterium]